ncbi:hypothetical protein JRQ81_017727 [Phrynocephalus forsythii]|uniref:Eukaryotic translation initiation factor 4 gamma 1 n=1 Tax=Phrynocephalus forsythii TaxID=171643 RepID=A0A9Q0XRX3_9SAUR|nr:hypothetical protein JRQ81_017727 [Phrynocephalus forsythii]
MNKAPQPSGGTPSAPHPSPSPGLPQQAAFPPGPTTPVVFNPAQATQMNTPSQPRQHFYQSRAQPPASASRVQSNTSARPGPPTHVYPAASQVMMIPSQISYPASQGAYYIPGQGRSTYVVPTQQYPVQPGAPSYYPGASPTEFNYAGAYYPAQSVQRFPAAQVMMNQQPPIPPKRERKTGSETLLTHLGCIPPTVPAASFGVMEEQGKVERKGGRSYSGLPVAF